MVAAMFASLLVATLAAFTPPAEQTEMLPATATQPKLFLRHLPGTGPSVLYIHGATFPSGSSIFWRIDGRSWADDLASRGFDVWGFDLAGYGRSGRPAAMLQTSGAPVGRHDEVVPQIERVVRHILAARDRTQLVLLAHSWGTIPAGAFAAEHPELVQRLVLFGAIAERQGTRGDAAGVPSLLVSEQDQWNAFQGGLPDGAPSPIARAIFEPWVRDYLASDPDSFSRVPEAVRVPSGPGADIDAAWTGRFPYDPSRVRVPTLLVSGAWDPVSNQTDLAWLAAHLSNVPGGARIVTLPRGAHRLHLENERQGLFDAVGTYLGDLAPV